MRFDPIAVVSGLSAIACGAWTSPAGAYPPPACYQGCTTDVTVEVTVSWTVDQYSFSLDDCIASAGVAVLGGLVSSSSGCGPEALPPDLYLDADAGWADLWPLPPSPPEGCYAHAFDGNGYSNAEVLVDIDTPFAGAEWMLTHYSVEDHEYGELVENECSNICGKRLTTGYLGTQSIIEKDWYAEDAEDMDMDLFVNVDTAVSVTCTDGFSATLVRQAACYIGIDILGNGGSSLGRWSGVFAPAAFSSSDRLGLFADDEFDPVAGTGQDYTIEGAKHFPITIPSGTEIVSLRVARETFQAGTPDIDRDGELCMSDWRAFFEVEGLDLNDSAFNPRADLNFDGEIDGDDWTLYISGGGCTGDYNCDFALDGFDLYDFELEMDLDLNRDFAIDGFDVEYLEQIIGTLDCNW